MNQVYEFDSYHVSPLFCFVFLMPLLMTTLTQNDVCQTNETNERIGEKMRYFHLLNNEVGKVSLVHFNNFGVTEFRFLKGSTKAEIWRENEG